MAPLSSNPVAPRKGRSPLAISYSSTPSDQMSLRSSAGSPRSISGAITASVPATTPSAVIDARDCDMSLRRLARQRARQAEIQHLRPPVSRDQHVRAFQVAMRHAAVVRVRERIGDLRPVAHDILGRQAALRNDVAERPSFTSSMTMKGWLSWVPTSWMVQMLGWFRRDACWASRFRRACASPSLAMPTLIATARPRSRSLRGVDLAHPAGARQTPDLVAPDHQPRERPPRRDDR